MKREAKHTIWINKYLRKSNLCGAIEIKQTPTATFNFSNVEPHQRKSLLAAQKSGLVWKISDADPRTKPCDTIKLPAMTSYVAIAYPGRVVFITIDDFLAAESRSQKKSLSTHEAEEIAKVIVFPPRGAV